MCPSAFSFYTCKSNVHVQLTDSTCTICLRFDWRDVQSFSVFMLIHVTHSHLQLMWRTERRDNKTIPFASLTLFETFILVAEIHEHHLMWKIRSIVRMVCQFRWTIDNNKLPLLDIDQSATRHHTLAHLTSLQTSAKDHGLLYSILFYSF
jgi:hypothetical protein